MSTKIIDYKVVAESDYRALEMTVKALMSKGWQPLGGVTISGHQGWFYQAMVKVERPAL